MERLPALASPAGRLTAQEQERYARHIGLPEVGVDGQLRLKNARVLVVGAGGLGSPVLLYLAAAGVGTIGIVDDDVVDVGNLQRQVIHGVRDVGGAKLTSARDSLAALNPLVRVRLHPHRLGPGNALDLLAEYDLVIDGSDNFATRYLVSDAAAIVGVPTVWGAIDRFDGQVSVFWAEHGPSYRDLHPEAPPAGSVPSCAEGGVLGVLCAAIGSMMAAEAIKLITGIGQTLLGRVLLFDARSARWREIALARDPAALPVTALDDYELLCGVAAQPEPGGEHVVTVHRLAALLADRESGRSNIDLIDVREPGEHALASIPGSRLIPQGRILSGEALDELCLGEDVVLYCKAGARSAAVRDELVRQGRSGVRLLQGGMLAWTAGIAPGPGTV